MRTNHDGLASDDHGADRRPWRSLARLLTVRPWYLLLALVGFHISVGVLMWLSLTSTLGVAIGAFLGVFLFWCAVNYAILRVLDRRAEREGAAEIEQPARRRGSRGFRSR
jgi:hypothetical protein